MSKVSILDDMGAATHPAVAQNIRNLAQSLRALSTSTAEAISSSVSQTELDAINAALSELNTEVQQLLAAEVQTYTAVTAISQYVPVYATGNKTAGIASASTPATLLSLIGIASGSVAAGAVVPLASAGQTIQNTAWTWIPGQPVYVGTGAALTQTLPVIAEPWQIGVALTSTILYVDPLPVEDGTSALLECSYATAAALPANTYANGSLGLGATLTATVNGALSVDGAAVQAGQRILVKNEATQANNGIYIVTATGGASAPYILTRTIDFCLASQIGPGVLVPIKAAAGLVAGTTNDGQLFLSGAPSVITVGTSAITFSATGQTYTGDGTTITLTGTQFGLTPITNLDLLANISGSSAKPVATTLSALLDAVLSSTQGAIVYRDSSLWKALAPGSSGQLLTCGGASANPSWNTFSAGAPTPLSGTYASRPGSPSSGQIYYCTDAPARLLYQAGAWQIFHRDSLVTPYNDANYSWVNQGSATLSAFGPFSFVSSPATTTDNVILKVTNVPAAPYTYTIFIKPLIIGLTYLHCGICLYDSVSGHFITCDVRGSNAWNSGGTSDYLLEIVKWNSSSSVSATYVNMGAPAFTDGIWFQIVDDNTNRTFKWSSDGVNFSKLFTVGRTDFITPNKIGFSFNTNNNTSASGISSGLSIFHASA